MEDLISRRIDVSSKWEFNENILNLRETQENSFKAEDA